MAERQYWIAVVPEDVVLRARAGGYAELSHGQPGLLEHLRAGDRVVFYCPRKAEARGNAVQAFVALGVVVDGTMYEAQRDDGTRAFRLAMSFVPGVSAPIKPMLDELSFIRSREHWGVALRHGARRIPAPDFERIAGAMQCATITPADAHPDEASPAELTP